jgi:hypothetical protein
MGKGEVFNSGYWSTIAQVLPVLFILLTVEYRMFHERETESLDTSMFLLTMLTGLAFGEVIALTALQEQREPHELLKAVVILGYTWALLGAFAPPIRGRLNALRPRLSVGQRVLIEYSALLAIPVLVLLAALDVISSQVLLGAPFGAVFLCWIIVTVRSDVQRFRAANAAPAPGEASTQDGANVPSDP